MAVYISSGRRRRRIIVAGVVGVVAGLLVGLLLGRWTAPSPTEQAREAKQLAARVTGQLEAFPIHYDQQSRNEIDPAAFRSSLDAGLKRADEDLVEAIALSAWLDEPTKKQLRDDIQAIRAAADRNAPPADFEQAVKHAVDEIELSFGQPAKR